MACLFSSQQFSHKSFPKKIRCCGIGRNVFIYWFKGEKWGAAVLLIRESFLNGSSRDWYWNMSCSTDFYMIWKDVCIVMQKKRFPGTIFQKMYWKLSAKLWIHVGIKAPEVDNVVDGPWKISKLYSWALWKKNVMLRIIGRLGIGRLQTRKGGHGILQVLPSNTVHHFGHAVYIKNMCGMEDCLGKEKNYWWARLVSVWGEN